ncbi:MAG: SEC-C metal-binding domain-containing protein [Candidatus Dormibacteraeota bacterium]|nr:SEC-C metal-binding domain-containing protein [Candidatus Dormibacteraeota bacterium]
MGKKKTQPKAVKASGSKPERARAASAANPVRPEDVQRPPQPPKAASASAAPGSTPSPAPFQRPVSFNFAGVGRNDICPCGSGKRFKNCHGH